MTWSTLDEMGFIDGLGTHRHQGDSENHRLELLLAYQSSMRNRREWGSIDPYLVRIHLSKRIANLTQKAGETQ